MGSGGVWKYKNIINSFKISMTDNDGCMIDPTHDNDMRFLPFAYSWEIAQLKQAAAANGVICYHDAYIFENLRITAFGNPGGGETITSGSSGK